LHAFINLFLILWQVRVQSGAEHDSGAERCEAEREGDGHRGPHLLVRQLRRPGAVPGGRPAAGDADRRQQPQCEGRNVRLAGGRAAQVQEAAAGAQGHHTGRVHLRRGPQSGSEDQVTGADGAAHDARWSQRHAQGSAEGMSLFFSWQIYPFSC